MSDVNTVIDRSSISTMAAEHRHLGWLISLASLLLVLYAAVLKDLVLDWWDDPNYSYAFFVPVVVAYVLRWHWDRIKTVPIASAPAGLAVMFGALGLLLFGTLAAEQFTARLSLVVMLAGMVLYLAGGCMLRALAFPLGYLLLMIPWPGIVYNQVTFPLQLTASSLAARSLELLSVPVFREGNLLTVPHYTAEVAEACSGIRSMLSLFALAIGFGYLAEKRQWARIVLAVLALPITVMANAVRIVGTCLLAYSVGPEWAEGFLHAFSGWVIFVIALVFMFAIHFVLSHLGSPEQDQINA